ncbi:MAG: hypothetical protein ACRDV3_16195 [Acidothermaceae bacterium]
MKRLFYLAAGAGVGVAVVRKVTKAANKFTPSGIAGSASESVSGVLGSLRGFVDEIRISMAEREIELHDALIGDQPDHRPQTPKGSRR